MKARLRIVFTAPPSSARPTRASRHVNTAYCVATGHRDSHAPADLSSRRLDHLESAQRGGYTAPQTKGGRLPCQHCHSPLAAGQRFCATCGARIEVVCPRCQAPIADGAAFCSQCGVAIEPPAASAAPPEAGERRQLTVLFCDLVDSTPLANRLDPEDFTDVISVYQEAVTEAVRRVEGEIGQYLGDGVIAYFGYPRAHEDDGLRAVSAAVEIRDALPAMRARMRELVPTLGAEPVHLRIGIHTGPVVVNRVGPESRQETQTLGDTMHLAARLQTHAAHDQILISDATRRLIAREFITEDVGLAQLKGIPDPVQTWRVLTRGDSRWRLERRAPAHLTPLVGRREELADLFARWRCAQHGDGQAVLIVGEPGVGKSRLVQALHERVTAEGGRWIAGEGSALHQGSAFHPVIAVLEQLVELRRDEPAADQVARLERALTGMGFPLRETMPLLANLLGLTLPPDYPAAAVEDPRRRTLDGLARWLLRSDDPQPGVLVVEDLHWLDASTLELLGVLIQRAAAAPVLLVMTARPEFTLPWPDIDRLGLRALEPRQTARLIELLAPERGLDAETVAQIVKRTDGVPLFVEELTKSVLEAQRGGGSGQTTPIPLTIQDSLTARLDRLGAAKQVAQIASLLGRTFPHDLLAAVSPYDPAMLDHALTELVDAGLVLPRGPAGNTVWSFKHALVRDAAYESMLRSTRRRQHAHVAEILERDYADRVEAEVIASHCEQGGRSEQAVAHYGRAAEQATRRAAHVEAIRHLHKAIELLEQLPASAERDRREFELQAALGPALITLHGYGEERAARAFERARALCGEMDDGPRLARALYGLSTYYQARADLPASIDLGERCLALATRTGDASLMILGNLRVGLSCYYAGAPARALEHYERALALHDPERGLALAFLYGQEPGALAAIYASLALWALGRPADARRRCAQALQIAEASGHAHTRAFIAAFAAALHLMLGDSALVEQYAASAIAIGRQRGFALWVGFGGVLEGWARAVGGRDPAAAIGNMQECLQQMSTIGMIVGSSFFLAVLADAQLAAGDRAAARVSVDAAYGFVQACRIEYWAPEVLRLRGLCSADTDPAAALADYERARELADVQGARGHRLRIATSAGALLHRLGHADEATRLLDAAVAELGGDGDSADLAAAQAQLAALRGRTTASVG
jgi:class 3 adenylate cyclase/tetratricopeptide (TPR) repeat protein